MLCPLLFLILMQVICLSVQLHVLSWVVASTHETPSLFHPLYSRDIHVMSSPHSLSLQSCFDYQLICLILQLCPTSMLSTTFLLHLLYSPHLLHLVCFLLLLFMLLLTVMLLLAYIDVLVYKQLDVFVSRHAHKHLISYMSRYALNGVFDFALLETIVPALLRGRWALVISGNMATLMVINLLVENKNQLEN